MKKIYIIFFAATLLLCSCSKKENMDHLEFPKTTWGMSMEETLDAYEITKEDTSNYDVTSSSSSFMIEGLELFGEKTAKIIFGFLDLDCKEELVLSQVKVMYPDHTDMNHVLEEMQKKYGETVSEISVFDLHQIMGDGMLEMKYTESEQLKIWAGGSVMEYIPENESEAYRDLWKKYQRGLNDENWDTFMKNARMVHIFLGEHEESNSLQFYAYNVTAYHKVKSQLPEQQ